MPETSEPLRPHSTKPPANAAYVGTADHSAKQQPYSAAARTSSRRRGTVSAQAPDGTSRTTWVADQMTSSVETWPVDRPASVKSRA